MRCFMKNCIVFIAAFSMILGILPLGSSAFAAPGDPDDWHSVGVPDFANSGSGKPSMAIYDGSPYVAFEDTTQSSEASVMRYNGTSWEYVGTPGFSGSMTGEGLTLVENAGSLYIANASANLVMKYDLDGGSSGNNTLILPNSVDNNEIFIETPEASDITCGTTADESNNYDDEKYIYPSGLVNFCFTTSSLDNEVSVTFVTDLMPNQVSIRRYDPRTKTYTSIPSAIIDSVIYEGQRALRVTYTITDNSSVDIDTFIGTVSDYIGFARMAEDDKLLAPDSGIGKAGYVLPITIFSGGIISITVLVRLWQLRMKR